MKLYLASFFEPENHSKDGRKVSVATNVPNGVKVNSRFDLFVPLGMDEYYKNRYIDPKNAGDNFVFSYQNQLNDLYVSLKNDSKIEKKSIQELLPFEEGDTLLSWEKSGNMSYRKMLAEFLVKLGYEVILK